MFELGCWRRFLRVPQTARRSNQSILKEISPGCSLEGLMLKLKLTLTTWCEELTHLNRPWCWERLRAGREGDDRGWDGQMASLTRWTWVWVNSKSWWWTGTPGVLWSMGSQRVGHDWVTELNGTETIGDQAGNKHELRLKCTVTITQWLAARALKTFHLHSCFLAASLGASYFTCGTHSPDLDKSWFPISRKY